MTQNMVVISGTLTESLEKGSILYYGTFFTSIPSRGIMRVIGLSANYVLGDCRLGFTVTLEGKQIVYMDDFPAQTLFQSALFTLFGTLLARVTGERSSEKHQFTAAVLVADEGAFEALCAGLARETFH